MNTLANTTAGITELKNSVSGLNSQKMQGLLCSLESLVPVLKPVSEKALKTLVEFDVLLAPQILLTDGGYIFAFHLKDKASIEVSQGARFTELLMRSFPIQQTNTEELFALYGVHKVRPRTWRSMDRMLRWFSERGLLTDSVALHVATTVSVHISSTIQRSSK